MRFFTSILAGAAIVAGVLAQRPTIDTVLTEVKAGESIEIEYRPADATATLVLRQGNPGNLDTITTVTENASGGKFTWNVPEDITNGNGYALQIIVDGEDNYSTRFEVSGGSEEPVSSAVSSRATTSVASTATETGDVTSTPTGASSTPASTENSTVTTSVVSTASETPSETPSPSEDPEEASNTDSGPPESTGAASTLGSSPLALVFGAVAAIAYLN